jgi:hypothetical protein
VIIIAYPALIVMQKLLLYVKAHISTRLLGMGILFGSLALFCFGEYLNYIRYQYNETVKMENEKSYQLINNIDPDYILYTEGIKPVLRQRSLSFYNKGYSIGWGTYFGKGSDGGVKNTIKNSLYNKKSVLVLAEADYTITTYPSYLSMLNSNYSLVQTIKGPCIYALYYKR